MIQYSKTIVFYNFYFTYMVPYAIANATRLGISTAQISELTSMKIAWDLGFEPYINPLTYGRLTVATINSLWDDYHKYSNGMVQQLKKNPSLKLIEADYLIFGIHKNSKSKIHKTVPTAQAAVIWKASTHLNNQYHIANIANPTSDAKPVGVEFMKVKLLVLPAGTPAPSLDILEDWGDVGSLNFDIPFTEHEEGKIAYVAVCFSNTAGDAAYSEIIANPII